MNSNNYLSKKEDETIHNTGELIEIPNTHIKNDKFDKIKYNENDKAFNDLNVKISNKNAEEIEKMHEENERNEDGDKNDKEKLRMNNFTELDTDKQPLIPLNFCSYYNQDDAEKIAPLANFDEIDSPGISGRHLMSLKELEDGKRNNEPAGGPEIEEFDDQLPSNGPQPGVDDGFYTPEDDPPIRPQSPRPASYPYLPPAIPRKPLFPVDENGGPDVFGLFPGTKKPDVNMYQQKKTLAQGMMDLALISANANQLRYVLEMSNTHPYYLISLIMISASIILQIGVGLGLIWNSIYNVKKEKEIRKANRINNFVLMGIFFITVINVFISAFGISTI